MTIDKLSPNDELAAYLKENLIDTLLEPNHYGDIVDDNINHIRQNIKNKNCVDLCTKEQAVELARVIFKE